MTISSKMETGSLHISSKFPFVTFHALTHEYQINEKEYKYQSHGGWLMLLGAMTPLLWKACPWTWGVGLGVGAVLALIFNVVSYLLFRKKINTLTDSCTETRQPAVNTPNSEIVLQPQYFIGKDEGSIFLLMEDGCRYLAIEETEQEMQQLIQLKTTREYQPTQMYTSSIQHIAKSAGIDGLVLRSQAIPLQIFDQQPPKDLLQEIAAHQNGIYVLIYEDQEEGTVELFQNKLLAMLNQTDAEKIAKLLGKLYQPMCVSFETISELVDCSDGLDGLCIVDGNAVVLYDESKEHVLSLISRIK